jgi:hypothetical protein
MRASGISTNRRRALYAFLEKDDVTSTLGAFRRAIRRMTLRRRVASAAPNGGGPVAIAAAQL